MAWGEEIDSLQFSFPLLKNIAMLAAMLQGLRMCQGGCGRTRKVSVSEVFPGYKVPMGIPVGSKPQMEDLI